MAVVLAPIRPWLAPPYSPARGFHVTLLPIPPTVATTLKARRNGTRSGDTERHKIEASTALLEMLKPEKNPAPSAGAARSRGGAGVSPYSAQALRLMGEVTHGDTPPD